MRLKDLQISMDTFYKLGIVSFSIIALMNLITLITVIKEISIFGMIASGASIIFYAGLAMFFNYLLNMTRPDVENEYASDDVEDIIRKIKEGKSGEHTRTKKKVKRNKTKTSLSRNKK